MRPQLLVLEADPPAEYVDFVSRHLAALRSATLRAVDDAHRAELLYPEVLTDVAMAWRRLESARLRGHPEVASDYLDRCLQRRVYGTIDSDDDAAGPDVEVRFVVWDSDSSSLPGLPPPGHERARQNAAVRIAEHLLPLVDPEPAPTAEAAIAWWHAYEQHRRRRQLLAAIAGLAVILYPLAVVSNSGATF